MKELQNINHPHLTEKYNPMQTTKFTEYDAGKIKLGNISLLDFLNINNIKPSNILSILGINSYDYGNCIIFKDGNVYNLEITDTNHVQELYPGQQPQPEGRGL